MPTAKTISQLVPAFDRYMETGTRLLPGSRRKYSSTLRQFAKWSGDPSIRAVTPQILLDWYAMFSVKGLAQGTFNLRHAAMVMFLTWLDEFQQERGATALLKAWARLKAPRGLPRTRIPFTLSEDEMRRIVAAAGSPADSMGLRDQAIVCFLWSTGSRRAEVASLQLEKLDIRNRTGVVLGKGDKERTVVFDEACQRSLRAWLKVRLTWPNADAETGNVFITATGKPMSPQSVWEVMKKACKKAGIKKNVWTHIFRHSAVTRLLDQGVPLHVVSQLAGHTDPRTTLAYAHTPPTNLKEEYDKATKGKEPA